MTDTPKNQKNNNYIENENPEIEVLPVIEKTENAQNQPLEIAETKEILNNKEEKSVNLSKVFLSLVIIFSTFGVIFHLIPNTRGFLVNIMTEPLLFIVNISLILWFLITNNKDKNILPMIGWLIITFVITLLLEIIGAATGLIFGEYSYGSVFNIKLFDVPIIIGFNWVVLILSGGMIVDNFIQSLNPLKNLENNFLDFFQILLVSFLNALLLGFFDWVLEPVAIFLDYWRWGNLPANQQIVPVQNYLAWMIIAFFFTLFYKFLKFKFDFVPLKLYFVIQLFFMSALNFFFTVFYN
jgi:putative membrane protein